MEFGENVLDGEFKKIMKVRRREIVEYNSKGNRY